MQTVSPTNADHFDIQQEYNKIMVQIEQAKKHGKDVIHIESLPYQLHLKLLNENYHIKKLLKKVPSFLFFKKTIKLYAIQLPQSIN
ncbi:hypothetical protein [Myroides injenensis]|uniref:hypothetical protein n=1 Tax=Myroides injenensis TaxID=1183151 RepID=UPI000288216D|nr:hypothetical protein [Myroides injenensis]